MDIKQLIYEFGAIGLMFNKPLKNIFPHYSLVEHAFIDDTGLLGVLKLGLEDFVVLIEYAACVRAEHEVEGVILVLRIRA
jgi:hypothetical protein